MYKVVVDRRTWNRGTRSEYGFSRLLNEKGYRCCLGFLVQQVFGLSDREIYGAIFPSEIASKHASLRGMFPEYKYPEGKGKSNEVLAGEVNDDQIISDEARESRLKEIGLRLGVEFEFIN